MALLFPNPLDQAVFLLLFVSIYFIEIVNQTFVAIKNRGFRIKVRGDGLSLFWLYFVGIFSFYCAIAFGLLRVNTGLGVLPPWFFYVGAAAIILGEALRQWSTYSLGRFFTGAMVIITDHKLVRSGPYKFLRHPAYLGGLIVNAGLGLAVQSWIAPLAIAGIMSLACAYRISLEERALKKEFGKQYLKYERETYRLIPYLF